MIEKMIENMNKIKMIIINIIKIIIEKVIKKCYYTKQVYKYLYNYIIII